jgi:glucokinase
VNPQRFMGLDLGGTNIKVAVLESAGGAAPPEVMATAQSLTHADRGPQGVTDRLIEVGLETIEDVGPVDAAGLGVPGLFEPDTGRIVLFPNLPGPWRGHSLRDPVARALGVPTALINDARAFVLAEGTVGAGRGSHTLVGLTLGTGIGGGIMIDGHVHLGEFGTGGEVGHQIVVPDGPLCGCGNHGCVEALARADTLAALAGQPDVATVYRRAADGDETCLAAIGGGIVASGELVLGPIREAMRSHVTLAPADEVAVVAAELGNWAGAIGAALAGRAQLEVRSR